MPNRVGFLIYFKIVNKSPAIVWILETREKRVTRGRKLPSWCTKHE